MIHYHVFPNGKKGAVTFSYDDGPKNDARLIALFDKYGVKGTFHLNSRNYVNLSAEELADIRQLYRNHEISCHTLQHGWPARMPSASLVGEVMQDRQLLERIARYPVQGMSYPFGDYGPETTDALKACGILYSRTTKATSSFHFPDDFLLWHPSCHHNDAWELCERFEQWIERSWYPLFYIWGHSFEFRTEEDWEKMEQLLERIARRNNIWYATNLEIYRYRAAQKALMISADETMFYNPSSIPVWVEKDGNTIIRIPAGELVRLT